MKHLAIIVAIISLTACGKPMHGGVNDIFKHSRSERPDLYSHATLGAVGAVAGAQVLEELGVKHADELGAIGSCAALTIYKEAYKDQWFDRGDAGANCYGAAGGYLLRKAAKALGWDGKIFGGEWRGNGIEWRW